MGASNWFNYVLYLTGREGFKLVLVMCCISQVGGVQVGFNCVLNPTGRGFKLALIMCCISQVGGFKLVLVMCCISQVGGGASHWF